MTGVFGWIGPGAVLAPVLLVGGAAVAVVVFAFWLFLFVGSGGAGPKVLRLGPLPPVLGRVAAAVAVVLCGVCLGAYATGNDGTGRAALPAAVAAAVVAVSLQSANPFRRTG